MPTFLPRHHRILALGLVLVIGPNCGKKKKEEKEPPLKPLRIEGLTVRFEKDREKTSVISVEYKTRGGKYEKAKGGWLGGFTDHWHLWDSKKILMYVRKLPRDFTVPESDAVLTTQQPNQEVGRVLDPGRYTFELKVFDKKSSRTIKQKITVVKPESTSLRPSAPPRPAGYKTLPITGLHVKLLKKTRIAKGPEGKTDRVKFKKGSMDIVKASASMTLKSHIKISKKLKGFKKFIKKKKGKGKEFWAVHLMKVKRKKLFIYMQVIERRGILWSCIGRSKKKKYQKTFRKVCTSLK